MKKRYLSELFENEPEQWGFRGDPYFWADLKDYFSTKKFPYSEDWLTDDIYRMFKETTGEDLQKDARPNVAKYPTGGMSGGMLSGRFWIENGIPMLVERYRKLSKEYE